MNDKQREILVITQEECAEVIQEISKIFRFGIDEMHKDGIMVAEYWTVMPPKKELEQKLHQLLVEAKERLLKN
jgi:hypothetical protein